MAESRIIHGFHAVTARIRQNADSVMEVFVDPSRKDPRARDLLKLAESNGVRVINVDGKRLDGMAGSTRHQGVAARVDASQKVQHLDDVLDTLTEPALDIGAGRCARPAQSGCLSAQCRCIRRACCHRS